MAFCRDCGAKLEEGQVCSCKQQTSQQSVDQQQVDQQPVDQQPVDQQPVDQQPVSQQPVSQQPVSQQPVYQRAYQQPVLYNNVSNQTNLEEPMSVSDWIVTFLLLCIPCANIVLMFVWAFSSTEKKSKSNFFKAYLILMLIVLVIYILVLLIFGAAIFAALPKSRATFY